MGGTTVMRRWLSAVAGVPAQAPVELITRYPELAKVRFRRGGLPPRVGGWSLGVSTVAAITLWRTIWLARDTRWDAELLLHELRHVHQFESGPSFPLRYVWETLRRGYHGNRFEVDARQYAAVRIRARTPHSTEDV